MIGVIVESHAYLISGVSPVIYFIELKNIGTYLDFTGCFKVGKN